MTEPSGQLVGGWGPTTNSGALGGLLARALGLVLVKERLGEQLGPSQVQPGSAEAATKCGSLGAWSRLLKARLKQRI